MKSVKESVTDSLDGGDIRLYPYLPYLLQDYLAFGTNPDMVNQMVRSSFSNPDRLRILDLGCGKGAVMVKLAKEFGCRTHGIDAVPEFIHDAKQYARQMGVEAQCHFQVDDIRTSISRLANFDLVILGSIGPVLGAIGETLSKLRQCLVPNGHIIIDDGYIPEGSNCTHSKCITQSQFFEQIQKAGFSVVSEQIVDSNYISEMNKQMLSAIKRRAAELIATKPHLASVFEEYIQDQQQEGEAMEELACSMLLLQRNQ